MRIAFVLNQFPLVSETFILQQIQGALARGHQVDIYAIAASQTEPRHPAYRAWKMDEHIRLRPAMGFRNAGEIFHAVRISSRPILRHPALFARCVLQCWQQRSGNPFVLFGAAVSVAIAGAKTYDVIHAHFADLGLLAIRLRRLGVLLGPILTSFHGVDVTRRRSARNLAALQQLFAQGDAFTHPSDYLGRRGRSMGCPEARQRKLYYGIDTASFHFKERTLIPGTPVRIVSVARLVEKKGIQYAIAAVAQLIQAGKNVEYDIIGEGPSRGSLETLIQTSGVTGRVRLLGSQDGDSVRRHLSEAHIFLLPSVTAENGDTEGLPVSILEAQMCGLPVVSTFHSGIPEGVVEGRSAFLVKERDVEGLAQRLGQLVDHPELWPAMGRAGRALVEERFDIEKLNDELIELYKTLRLPMEKAVAAPSA